MRSNSTAAHAIGIVMAIEILKRRAVAAPIQIAKPLNSAITAASSSIGISANSSRTSAKSCSGTTIQYIEVAKLAKPARNAHPKTRPSVSPSIA